MAEPKRRTSAAARRKKSTPKPEESLEVKVVLVPSEDVPEYYINFAEISYGIHDFNMSVVRIPNRLASHILDEARDTGEIKLEPLLQLVFPVSLISGLIDALTSQKELQQKNFGDDEK